MLARLNAGKYGDVPAQLRRWINAGGVKVMGLVTRRENEIKLWFMPANGASVPADFRSVRYGSTGAWVRKVQAAAGVAVDGHFGQQTERAVIAFQKTRALVADGIVGPLTARALGII